MNDPNPLLRALHARYDHDITLCVHAHNRLFHLQETLPANLACIRTEPRVGMVLLDYNSRDDLDVWVREHYQADIASGKLIYAREGTARWFHASKSKNLAHRLAPGRLLVNLDGDNFIDSTLPFLRQIAAASDRVVAHTWSGTFQDGTYGRIAISRALFHAIGGYDEALLPMGYQDTDLVLRAASAGADVVRMVGKFKDSSLQWRAIKNSKEDALRNTSLPMLGFTLMNTINKVQSHVYRNYRGDRANPSGWARGALEVNFETSIVLT